MTGMKWLKFFLAGLAVVVMASCNMALNETLHVKAGENYQGSNRTVNGMIIVEDEGSVDINLSTVNGAIRVGKGSSTAGLSTVNGMITVGAGSKTGKLETVNGYVQIGKDVKISGSLATVNGYILLDTGSEVESSIGTVNGFVALIGATVDGNASTVKDGVFLADGAVVKGNIVAKDTTGDQSDFSQYVIIGENCVVEGQIEVAKDRKIMIHSTATVKRDSSWANQVIEWDEELFQKLYQILMNRVR